MKRQKNFQLATIAVLAFAVLFMSIGFAVYSQTLNITGVAKVDASKWSVHFDTIDGHYQRETGSVTPTEETINGTSMSYKVHLTKPGDYYAFNMKVVNDGTFNATLDTITMSSLTAAQAKYLSYTLVYDGQTYTSTTSGINTALVTGASDDVTVRVEYILPQDAADLPTEAVDVNLSASLDYVQAD